MLLHADSKASADNTHNSTLPTRREDPYLKGLSRFDRTNDKALVEAYKEYQNLLQ